MQKLKLTLPWISSKLSAHNKGHWRSKAQPTADARAKAKAIATRLILDGARHLKGKTSVRYLFFVPDNVRRDSANMVQSCKPFIDGIVDAGLVAGDHWQVFRLAGVDVDIDRDNPRVELVIEEES